MNRLAYPMGRFINREKSVSFTFEGKTVSAFEGDTIASALLASGQWLFSRSFKYHRARGPLTMAGQDANTLVQLTGDPNVLADRHLVRGGETASAQNVDGTLDHDRAAGYMGKLSKFMPPGFYYRAFYKPRGMWKRWEPVIRKKAGLGVLDLGTRSAYYDKAFLFYDVAVIGGGPAGMSAALAASNSGARVLLVEQDPVLGGSLNYARFDVDGLEAPARQASLSASIRSHANIRVLTSAVCNGRFADNFLEVIQGNRLWKVRAAQVVVASGAFDQPVVFRNNDLPGVMLTSAAQRLMRLYGVRPGRCAVVLTGNDDGYLAALDLAEQGVDVAALVDMRSGPNDAKLLDAIAKHGIRHHAESTVFEAFADAQTHRVSGVDVRKISGKGKVSNAGVSICCDVVCMSSGYMPVYQLLCQANACLRYDDATSAFMIEGLPASIKLAGSVDGFEQLDDVIAHGVHAGARAAADAGFAHGSHASITPPARATLANFNWPIFPHPKGKEFVDFDEDLQISDIVNATSHGYRDIQLVKRFTTVGMGPSQGRHSALATARLVASATNRSVSDTGVTTARPPFTEERLAVLAGRSFSPYRETAMHGRHIEAGAQMMPAGAWSRPAYYGTREQRERWVREEAKCVREKVGMIDVSTLGGLEIRGPDAVEFLERMYTFTFRKLEVGKTRYALLVNEEGAIGDDGVACRLAENHFYVTATTNNVAHVFQSMLQWNAQWRLEVDIFNATTAFSAVNLAGPLSRKVLEKLCDDVDLSSAAFPYLGVRQGKVAGIAARIMRVGFVGELGYEIHVPTSRAVELWDALMQAGKEFGIRPFGVEAQRILRLEKGHVIIGQDTDALTHPLEIDMGWAIGRKKPFFVGKRSLAVLEAQPLTRKLIGFTLPASVAKPFEGNLILRDGEITGAVTSCEYSVALDRFVGLAYASPLQATHGGKIDIRLDDGQVLKGTVTKPPFYDPATERQEM
ncbi:2Fe-2S iron-sulfur cluster-binding protein [Burkholderia anthina]|uniref:2Fe-2S iron-sulfur cluster-binding protein n=1 Tax=Burkholderia anthina TaxID=179879 RepID=UPI001AA09F91|nr:2Fe-2S iron-sulfur cluster-binding protein [Burkholderia anthina]QTD94923.1 (2Fe-2S)-binding protein [Burkholderia anthina]